MSGEWFWILAAVTVVSGGLVVSRRQRSARVQARKSADLEARGGQPLPGPNFNTHPDLAALRERFIQSIEDGGDHPSFWGHGRKS